MQYEDDIGYIETRSLSHRIGGVNRPPAKTLSIFGQRFGKNHLTTLAKCGIVHFDDICMAGVRNVQIYEIPTRD